METAVLSEASQAQVSPVGEVRHAEHGGEDAKAEQSPESWHAKLAEARDGMRETGDIRVLARHLLMRIIWFARMVDLPLPNMPLEY